MLSLVAALAACAWLACACALAQEGGMADRLRGRVRAPELAGGRGWLNTDKPLTLAGLRGKVVLLDFWTYGCVNCMHVIPDLKRLEEKYARQLVVVGVHSAKFANEKETENIRRVVLRYEIEHPVVNDADFAIWRAYAVRAWPTLVLVDPEGYVAGRVEGEGNYDALDRAISQAVSDARKRGVLNEQPLKFALERAKVGDLPLAFPGKVLADERGGRLFVSDSDHNRIVVAKLDGTLVGVIGTGERGAADGAFDRATFHRPQGLALDAGKNSDDDALYVADTENHLIRKVDLRARTVTTVAGTGRQSNTDPREEASNSAPARATALNSPWDLQLVGRRLYIAMAGPHQIWRMNLTTGAVSVFAGTGREARADGPRLAASFAQPSGLATDGSTLFVADAESNVIRAVTLATGPRPSADDGEPRTESDSEGDALPSVPSGEMPRGDADDDTKAVPTPTPEDATPPQVATLAGGDLFDFGDADGEGDEVRLQHPLGVQYVEGYGVFVADTYNHKIKLLDPSGRTVKTVAGTGRPGQADGAGATFYEPGGISYAAGKLYVADTNNHAIRVVDPATGKTSTLALRGLTPPASTSGATADADAPSPPAEEFKVEPQRVAANSDATLTISVELPAGYHLNESAPQRYRVNVADGARQLMIGADPATGLSAWRDKTLAGTLKDLPLRVPVRGLQPGSAELLVQLTLYYCREDNTGVCRIKTLVWRVPVSVSAEANAPREIRVQGRIE